MKIHFYLSGRMASVAIVAFAAAAFSHASQAQIYPTKALRFIVPFSAGGSTDLSGRLVAADMSTALGQPVVVENRAGAAGNIGVEAIIHSAPDGYTIGFSGMGPSVLTHLSPTRPPFSVKDMVFIGHAGLVEMMIIANKTSPYTNVKSIIDAAKASPGKIPYGHGGTASPAHLAFELFKAMAGLDMPAIPYKGDAPTLTDVMGGQEPIGSVSVAGGSSQVKAGGVRAVAVYSPQRSPALPDVPTVAESGIPGFEAGTFNMLVGPAGIPAPIVQRLNSLLNEAEQKPAIRDRFIQMGIVPVINTPQQAADFVARETAKWSKVIREAHIQLQ